MIRRYSDVFEVPLSDVVKFYLLHFREEKNSVYGVNAAAKLYKICGGKSSYDAKLYKKGNRDRITKIIVPVKDMMLICFNGGRSTVRLDFLKDQVRWLSIYNNDATEYETRRVYVDPLMTLSIKDYMKKDGWINED